MKVAIVHDYIKEYGGAERVLEAISEIYPEAPIYTIFYSPSFLGPHKERFKNLNIKTTWFQYVPFKNKLLSYFRLIAPVVFRSINLSGYDVVITSATGTYTSPNFVKIGTKTKLICYCHTPPRYLYGYATAAPWKSLWWRKILYAFGQLPIHFLRLSDFQSAQKPDFFIANSEEVSRRIKKFYRRDSDIIYPPVEIPVNSIGLKDRSYYLAGGRLARPKHVELAVLACTKLKLPLRVFGREFSGYGKELHEMAGPTVEFLGEVSDEKKWDLYKGAKAFFFPAEDEDFGIMPVEAMAAGTPVIAYKSGGVMETVVEGKTGMFFDELTVESLISAIKKFDNMSAQGGSAFGRKLSENCISQAQKFSKERFEKEIRDFVRLKIKDIK